MNDFKKLLVATFATCLCFICSIPIKAQEKSDSVYEEDPYFLLMGEADDAIAERNWPVAAARLCDALAVQPENPANSLVYNNLANVYTYMGYDSLAVKAYSNGLELAPRMLKLLLGRGRTLLSMGRPKEAFNDFTTAIEIDSVALTPRYYRGMMLLYSGNAEGAEADFSVLEKVAPKSFDTAVALGTLYSLTGRDREAIPYLEKALEHDPSPEFFSSLAGCQLALGMLSEASATISDGLAKYPDDPELYYYRAWLNRDRYRRDDARRDADQAIKLGANPMKVNDLFK